MRPREKSTELYASSKEEFNNEPVVFCKHCLSLAIRVIDREDDDLDYCDHCGSTDLGKTDIETWEFMYKQRILKKL